MGILIDVMVFEFGIRKYGIEKYLRPARPSCLAGEITNDQCSRRAGSRNTLYNDNKVSGQITKKSEKNKMGNNLL